MLEVPETLVVMACNREHENLLRSIISRMARRERIIDEYIIKDSSSLSSKELHELANNIVDEQNNEKLMEQVREFPELQSKSLATDELTSIAKAIYEGRVSTLLVSKGRGIPGTYSYETGDIVMDMESSIHDSKVLSDAGNDVSDALVHAAIAQGADVKVMEQENMPTDAFVAAYLRWAA